MNHRKTFVTLSLGWVVLVSAALVAPVPLLRDRLPDPIATHWGFSGVPDGSMSLTVFPLVVLPGWVVLAGAAVITGVSGRRRAHRGGAAATLGGAAAFFAGLMASTLWVNLDQAGWQHTRLPVWHVLPVLLGAAAAAWIGWWIGNRGPDEPAEHPDDVGELILRPGRREVWVSSVTSPVLVAAAGASALVGVGLVLLVNVVAALPLLLVSLVVAALSTARIRVDERGVHTAFGPQRFPSRRIRLDKISAAGVGHHRAMSLGGWGYRVLPSTTAIMLRSGDCLVLRLSSGRDFAISVDKPERGAELVNALLAERSAM